MKSNAIEKSITLETPKKTIDLSPEVESTRSKIFQQIPVAEIELSYVSEIPREKRLKIKSSRSAVEILRTLWNPNTFELQECFNILLLNNSNHIVGFYPHSRGGITGTLTDIRLIFIAALKCGAVGLILSHNHPSGTLKPSRSDIALTEKIKKAGRFLDIKILDHIILTKEGFYSFADDGEL